MRKSKSKKRVLRIGCDDCWALQHMLSIMSCLYLVDPCECGDIVSTISIEMNKQ